MCRSAGLRRPAPGHPESAIHVDWAIHVTDGIEFMYDNKGGGGPVNHGLHSSVSLWEWEV